MDNSCAPVRRLTKCNSDRLWSGVFRSRSDMIGFQLIIFFASDISSSRTSRGTSQPNVSTLKLPVASQKITAATRSAVPDALELRNNSTPAYPSWGSLTSRVEKSHSPCRLFTKSLSPRGNSSPSSFLDFHDDSTSNSFRDHVAWRRVQYPGPPSDMKRPVLLQDHCESVMVR